MITKENLAKANLNLDTVPVKGKKYVMVVKRLQAFRDICPAGSIKTIPIVTDKDRCIFQAEIRDEKGNLLATGTAEEAKGSTQINQTSFVENCETSAVGRAFAFLGIGSEENMASAEEVATAIMNQTELPEGKRALSTYCSEHALELSKVWSEHHLSRDDKSSTFYAVLAKVMEEQGE